MVTNIGRFKFLCTSPFPATVDCKLRPRTEDEEGGEWTARQKLGSLTCAATTTRTYISNDVWGTARLSHNLSQQHSDPMKRILKYLKYARTEVLARSEEGTDLDTVCWL